MQKTKSVSRSVVISALIAAIYAALTYFSAALGIAYGNIQFRLSEALNILALFTPAAIPGLTIGCVLGNITSPLGLIDVVLGAVATLLSVLTIRILGQYLKKGAPYLAVLPPTIFNAVIVGLEITFFTPETASFVGFLIIAAEVAISEIGVMLILGLPLYYILKTGKLGKHL